jgi:hypothetical protein
MTCFCSKHSRLTQLPPRRQRLYRPQDHVRPRESRRYRTVSNRHESDRGVLTRPIRERLVSRRRAYRRAHSIAAESSFRVNLACVRFPQKPVSVLSVRLSPQRAADNDTDTTPRSFPLSYTGCRFIVYRILLSGVFMFRTTCLSPSHVVRLVTVGWALLLFSVPGGPDRSDRRGVGGALRRTGTARLRGVR